MMKTLKAFGMFIFALIAMLFLWLFVFVYGLFKFKWKDYFFTIAIGIDQLGGSFIYNKKNWTISGYTGYLVTKGNQKAKKFSRFINWLFQDDEHCAKALVWDLEIDARSELK